MQRPDMPDNKNLYAGHWQPDTISGMNYVWEGTNAACGKSHCTEMQQTLTDLLGCYG